MFQDMPIPVRTLASGEVATISTFTLLTGRASISTSSGYSFTDDYDYAIVETYGQGNAALFRLNGTTPADQKTVTGTGSIVSASYPTEAILYKNVKSGDTIKITSGSLVCTIFGIKLLIS